MSHALPPETSANRAVAVAAPFLFAAHFAAELLSLLTPLLGVWWVLRNGGLFLFVVWTVISIVYIYPITLLMILALLIRVCPKPQPGVVRSTTDAFKFIVLAGFSRGAIMSNCSFWLSCLPFPAHWFYKVAGGRIHWTVFISTPSILPDPWNVEIGPGCVLGQGSVVAGHVHTAGRTLVSKTRLGANVLIGVNSFISGGVSVGDGARVSPNSFLPPGTHVPPNEVWAGNPARRIELSNSKPAEE